MARVFQDTRQKREAGRKASWYVEWRVGGKRCSRKIGGKMAATEFARQVEAQLAHQDLGLPVKKTWEEFRSEYERVILPIMRSEKSRKEARNALGLLERLARPSSVRGIDRHTFDEYVSQRRLMRGHKPGSVVAPATIRKELRTIRAALSAAHEWGWLSSIPSLPRVQGLGTEKRFITEDHFTATLKACGTAQWPLAKGQHYEAGDWWRALLGFLWVAPLRIGSALALSWTDVDLDRGTALSRACDNKQKRDQRAFFPLSVAELLRRIKGFNPLVFPWHLAEAALYRQFRRIQEAAGIKLPCEQRHQHTETCHYYTFHDFRRAFATYNRDLPALVVQGQMGHSTYQTTLHYDRYGRDNSSYASKLHVPDFLKTNDMKSTCDAVAGS